MSELSQTVYFHGLPGSGGELALFDDVPTGKLAHMFVPIRDGSRTQSDCTAYMDSITRQIEARFPEGRIHLIGFSLGAFVAIHIATLLKNRVERIDLVSAAAPLEMGDFLKDMAGRIVFQTAQSCPFLFSLMVKWQCWAARWFPNMLFKAIFANTAGQDRELAATPAFQKGMARILKGSLGRNALIYQSEIAFYVSGWAASLAKVRQPVTLWQGEADNWTPPAMADALQKALPNLCSRRDLMGLSHYSTLRHFLGEYASSAGEKN
jgi:pimeloyl-ACP methyl ester carboxylesterase